MDQRSCMCMSCVSLVLDGWSKELRTKSWTIEQRSCEYECALGQPDPGRVLNGAVSMSALCDSLSPGRLINGAVGMSALCENLSPGRLINGAILSRGRLNNKDECALCQPKSWTVDQCSEVCVLCVLGGSSSKLQSPGRLINAVPGMNALYASLSSRRMITELRSLVRFIIGTVCVCTLRQTMLLAVDQNGSVCVLCIRLRPGRLINGAVCVFSASA
ncbi:hypothetical protein RRG08_059856 [Elysia crispata]|uniref:Uncharacterized protein n=1 Tax=Elysia crispata TaxID=231223 RepID=A0AAE1AGH7_9GAST|nr:hypothetical protein RRG08_059856 [Elysia crispata]